MFFRTSDKTYHKKIFTTVVIDKNDLPFFLLKVNFLFTAIVTGHVILKQRVIFFGKCYTDNIGLKPIIENEDSGFNLSHLIFEKNQTR